MKIFRGFALAWNMLTILPFFKVHDFFKGINGYSVMLYPLVGLLLGTVLFLVHFALSGIVPPLHAGVIVFVLWVVLSGGLHLDGFSDTVDGLFVARDKAITVMKDAHVGGMGMVFTVVFLLLKLSSLLFMEAYYLLPVVLMLSRFNASVAIYFYKYISSGVGTLLKEEFTKQQLLVALAYTLVVAYLFSFVFAFIVSLLVLLLIARFFIHRLGGLSGDIYGFIIEVSELVLLNYIVIAYSL